MLSKRAVPPPNRPLALRIAASRPVTDDALANDVLNTGATHRSDRLEMMGRLTGGVAHDINNLLTAILLNSDVLVARVADRQLSELAETTRMSAERAGDLTRRLLGFVGDRDASPRLTDVNAAIGALGRLLGRTLGEHIEVRLETEATSPWVLVDPARLETAILNLAVNARDAMPRGGHLVIRTRNDHGRGRNAAGDWVTISVIDDGTGMTPDVLARAREPFFTTKADGRGTGLGLSIVQTLARESGGRLRIESRPGIRTAVALMLPGAAAPAVARPDEATRDAPTGSESILLVEDDRIVRAHVETTLIDLGYRVASVADPAGALEWLTAHKWIDLLFTDMVMPGGIGGGELARHIRGRLPRLKVLYTSGYAAPPEWTGLGPDSAFLPKPFRRAGLGAAVRALLDRAAA